ncbi:hypothetical protein HMPREF3217_00963 [Finegoldia magna]|nr:hypothetical protein HMPREF3217_00963 [Finegoldia magna]
MPIAEIIIPKIKLIKISSVKGLKFGSKISNNVVEPPKIKEQYIDKTPKLFPKIINAMIYKIVSIIITKIPVGICGKNAFKLIAIPEIPPIVKLKGIIKKKKPKVSINVPIVNIINFLIILFMLSPPIF